MENKRLKLANDVSIRKQLDIFDGTLQKYRWNSGFPNHEDDSWSQWTHIEGVVMARCYTDFVNTVDLQLILNGYSRYLQIYFEKAEV